MVFPSYTVEHCEKNIKRSRDAIISAVFSDEKATAERSLKYWQTQLEKLQGEKK